jgi:hypothetical protein
MVGFVPTVFVGWAVGLLCDVLSLLVFCVLVIGACVLRFGSLFGVELALLFSWGKDILLFVGIVRLYLALLCVGEWRCMV